MIASGFLFDNEREKTNYLLHEFTHMQQVIDF